MTPDRLLSDLKKRDPAPVYLFLGPEPFARDQCREAIIDKLLAPEERESGVIRHDLSEVSLASVIDDARSFSLFSPRRVIWASSAEAALPRGRAAADDGEDGRTAGDASLIAGYVKDPSPDVVLVFDSSRFEMDGEDKAKSERVRKFYSGVPNVVEFARFNQAQALALADGLAKEYGLRAGPKEIRLLVEAVGANAQSISVEIEKLRLFAGDRAITAEDIAALVPQAQATTIFALVGALGRNDRGAALNHLDTLVREGEYLPLALAFLATQFRQALVAREAGLRDSRQIQGHFSKLGVPMWPSRAEQVAQTLNAFTAQQMANALRRIAAADKALRDIRPDDRVVMEEFVLSLTA